MGRDPATEHNGAEPVRPEGTRRSTPRLKLDPVIIERIAQKVSIFAGMSHPCLLRTLASGEHFPVRMGEPVFREGDIGNSFYVLVAGDVTVEKRRDNKPVELARLGPGQCFGEMALVGNDVRSATVRAHTDVVALRFYRELIDALPESSSIIYRNIARVLAARLGDSSVALADLVSQRKAGVA